MKKRDISTLNSCGEILECERKKFNELILCKVKKGFIFHLISAFFEQTDRDTIQNYFQINRLDVVQFIIYNHKNV